MADRWADPHEVLTACLQHLPKSITEGRRATVLDSWIDSEKTFCVVYEGPYVRGVVGWRFSTGLPRSGFPRDAEELGQNLADFSIGEPLGTLTEHVRIDATGVQWLGELLPELPRRGGQSSISAPTPES